MEDVTHCSFHTFSLFFFAVVVCFVFPLGFHSEVERVRLEMCDHELRSELNFLRKVKISACGIESREGK